MKIKHKIFAFLLTSIVVALTVYLYPYAVNSAVLDSKGLIGLKQQDLMYVSSMLMLIVVIPVFILTFAICLRYRASNKSAEYMPNWNHDNLAESIWWGFPALIIFFLSLVTWYSTNELDPFKPLRSSIKPVKIQVVALEWKWLFIYPEEKIATLNFLQVPEGTPLNFEITADAPMNSFWIPDLGGQIYAMPGMSTKLNLFALQSGNFRGSSANLSGEGFAGMHFVTQVRTPSEYQEWVKSMQGSEKSLDVEEYNKLVLPSEYVPIASYTLKDEDLFNQIVMKYMMPVDADGGI